MKENSQTKLRSRVITPPVKTCIYTVEYVSIAILTYATEIRQEYLQ